MSVKRNAKGDLVVKLTLRGNRLNFIVENEAELRKIIDNFS